MAPRHHSQSFDIDITNCMRATEATEHISEHINWYIFIGLQRAEVSKLRDKRLCYKSIDSEFPSRGSVCRGSIVIIIILIYCNCTTLIIA
jgi:hypothetical protein